MNNTNTDLQYKNNIDLVVRPLAISEVRVWFFKQHQVNFSIWCDKYDMRRGRFAKNGLIQYQIVCKQVNVGSLEEVIKPFLHLSTEKVENAKTQSEALEEALDIDDLEADKRPEDLMLSYIGGEKGKDISDRELVTLWLEAYRMVLEILRNKTKLEAFYAEAFRFV
ncbi:hypothetical protein C5167_021634 [Papaver somniferum]|nr:hypothetical protein C5167_021634 [Papaver somniferum]